MAVLEVLATATDRATPVIEGMEQRQSRAAKNLSVNWKKVGAGVAAAGAAMEVMARRANETNESVARLEYATGIHNDTLREMARELSDVTLPYNEVIDLMQAGREQGLKSAEQLGEFAEFWDMVSDATGIASDKLAESGVALRAVGIDAGNEAEALAAFGFITQETSGDVDEFMRFLERTGPELRELGLDINDAAAIMAVFEHDMGMSGRMARQEFRRAVNDADGSVEDFMQTLKDSGGDFDTWRNKADETGEVIIDLAKLYEEHHTSIQKFVAGVQNLTTHHSELIAKLGDLAPIMTAVGTAMISGKVIWGAVAGTIKFVGAVVAWVSAKLALLLGPALKATIVGVKALAAAFIAISAPVWGTVAAILAVVAALGAVWYWQDEVGDFLYHSWEGLKMYWDDLWTFMTTKADGAMTTIGDFLYHTWDGLNMYLNDIWAAMVTAWQWAWDGMVEVIKNRANAIIGYVNWMIRAIERMINAAAAAASAVPGVSIAPVEMGQIPTLHTGGTFRTSNPGGEGLAMLQDGERVLARGARGSGDQGQVIVDQRGLFDGANIRIARPEDAQRISEETFTLARSLARAQGGSI